jgi:tetratricopeptide (TPR) repeat protein
LLPAHSAHASPSSAATAYKHGDFSAAERDYSTAAAGDPKQPILQFDAGTAAYKAGEFPQAARAFQASVNASTSGSAQRLVDQEDAYYNLGNTLYREGQKSEQGDPKTTMQNWTQALKAYDAALQLRADDADSKFNRELVKRKLEALKKTQSLQSKSPLNQPEQPSQPQQSKPQQGQGQQSKDHSSASKPQQQAGQPKRQPGGPPQEGKGQQGQPNGQLQQANGQPQQAKQDRSGTPSSKDQTNPDQSSQTAQQTEPSAGVNGPRPRPDRAEGNADSQPGQLAQAGDDRRLPGEMSRQEARELLDSVKDEERRPPAAPVARNGASDTSSVEPLKDW